MSVGPIEYIVLSYDENGLGPPRTRWLSLWTMAQSACLTSR